MTNIQFHALAGPIWLIASNVEPSSWFAVACSAMFAYHGVALAWAVWKDRRNG
jgi:hypothetical protein